MIGVSAKGKAIFVISPDISSGRRSVLLAGSVVVSAAGSAPFCSTAGSFVDICVLVRRFLTSIVGASAATPSALFRGLRRLFLGDSVGIWRVAAGTSIDFLRVFFAGAAFTGIVGSSCTSSGTVSGKAGFARLALVLVN